MWDDNFEDPANIIRQTENITGTNVDYKFQVYSLPNRPIRITDEFINSIDMEQKMDIIAGLCRGIDRYIIMIRPCIIGILIRKLLYFTNNYEGK